MKQSTKVTITPGQLALFIIQTQVGVGVLSMPYSVFDAGAKTDGWISIILAGVLVQVMVFVFMLLAKRFPTLNLYEILEGVFGKWLGKFFTFLHIIYFISVGILILILFSSILDIWAFPNTPQSIKIGLAVLTATYLAKENVRIIARFHVVVSILMVLIIAITFTAFTHIDVRYILPIGHTGVTNIVMSVKAAMLSLLGFELFIILFSSTEGSLKQKVKAATLANATVTFTYAYLAIVCYLFFSPEELAFVPEPILYLIKSFSFVVVERTDLIFISIWIVSVMTSFIGYLYIASLGVASLFNKSSHSPFVFIIAVLIFVFSVTPHNVLSIATISGVIGNAGTIFSFFVPIFILLVAITFKRKEQKNDQAKKRGVPS
ncbi:GerAB/ArcD/ProY family transporter [Alkalihalophilus lindianensis]|uniref:GerAB/ArcD/ProY family transporter n=1 Tax=Alkalihalophilus lindianensis TaxID=1630542 RepID=A0ABU3X5R6_9BACI|nr:GerAB/ArcD/ProY family transporter [Alkalihalophilus lindianensis]MDV2683230.1 GerAB/ArcD/ProY family transporter [Alkalihalophilus lindianensis]